jgi:hypothetical protein
VTATIAEVLHRAADEFLWSGRGRYDFGKTKFRYSCDAAAQACKRFGVSAEVVLDGLREMGVNTDSINEFGDKFSSKTQAARFMWLKFAALIAEEQGV